MFGVSETELAPERVYPSRILKFYFTKCNLILSSHLPSPSRTFNSTSPNTVALQSIKQNFELRFSNRCKQAEFAVFKRNFPLGFVALNFNSYSLH